MQILITCDACGHEKRPVAPCDACEAPGDALAELTEWRRRLRERASRAMVAELVPAPTQLRELSRGPRTVVFHFEESLTPLVAPGEAAEGEPQPRSFDWHERGVLRRLRRAA